MTKSTNTTTPPPLLKGGVYLEPKYLRPAQAATRAGVTEAYIWKLLAGGSLPSHKLGSARLIKATDLDQLIERNG